MSDLASVASINVNITGDGDPARSMATCARSSRPSAFSRAAVGQLVAEAVEAQEAVAVGAEVAEAVQGQETSLPVALPPRCSSTATG